MRLEGAACVSFYGRVREDIRVVRGCEGGGLWCGGRVRLLHCRGGKRFRRLKKVSHSFG